MRSSICLSIAAALLVRLYSCQNIRIRVDSPGPLVKAYPDGFTGRIIMWGKQSTFEDVKLKLERPNPADGCTNYHMPNQKKRMAYVVTGLAQCPLTSLIQNAQSAGAQALFIMNHQDTNVDDIQIPAHISGRHLLIS